MDTNDARETSPGQTRFIPPAERLSIIEFLLSASMNGAIARGHITDAVIRFSRSPKTVRMLWQRCAACQTPEERIRLLTGPLTQGGRQQHDRDAVRERIRRVDMQDRMTIRSLAASADTTRYMVQRLVAEGIVRRKTTRLHPLLNADQEHARLRWVLSWLQEAREGGFEFVDMNNVVHVDEKWFNEDSDRKSYYVLDGEEPPHRMQRSKRFIGKIMFLAAVARPR